ncbi:MAG: ATP-binding protein [Bacteroidota bacterium]
MIISFSVKNFYSIKDEITLSFEAIKSNDLSEFYFVKHELEQDLNILKLGLIYGANASGKTTILKSLSFLRQMVVEPFDKKNEPLSFLPFFFDKASPKSDSELSIDFIANGTRYKYKVEFNNTHIVNETLRFFSSAKSSLLYRRKTNPKSQLTEIRFGKTLVSRLSKVERDSLQTNTLWNNTVLGGYLKTNISSKEFHDVSAWFEKILQPMIEPHNHYNPYTNLTAQISNGIEKNDLLKKAVLEILQKADLKITNIEVVDRTEETLNIVSSTDTNNTSFFHGRDSSNTKVLQTLFHHTVSGKTYRLPIELESDGTVRYYHFAGLLASMVGNSVIYSIDEIASSLHPDLLKHFLLTFLANTKTSQLIATTHHRELLKERDILRDDAIWFTEKKEDGSTDLFSLTDFDTSVVRDTSSIYNAYKIGKLGAVPELEDHYID